MKKAMAYFRYYFYKYFWSKIWYCKPVYAIHSWYYHNVTSVYQSKQLTNDIGCEDELSK